LDKRRAEIRVKLQKMLGGTFEVAAVTAVHIF